MNQTLVMVKLDISNKIHNLGNSISNAQILQIVISVGIGGINYQSWISTVSTWVSDILFVLTFLFNDLFNNNNKWDIYLLIGNTPLP